MTGAVTFADLAVMLRGGQVGLTSVELCAGAGGTALGLAEAGFRHLGLVELDGDAVATLQTNRPAWPAILGDIAQLDGAGYRGADLVSAGLPCPPHSRAGKRQGAGDERHLWSQAMRLVSEVMPRCVLIETVDGILTPRFDAERAVTLGILDSLGYRTRWRDIVASQYGVGQVRRRAILIAFSEEHAARAFRWPDPLSGRPPTLGDVIGDLVAAGGWPGAAAWRDGAQAPAPTVSIGSKLHGGADLGPSQTKRAFAKLGVDALGLADEPPDPGGKYVRGRRGRTVITGDAAQGVMLTPRMLARVQGFADDWMFCGGKTSVCRQIGNAFPPPCAAVLGAAIRNAVEAT